jgi:ribosomal protein S18 acetylase RimI-like enzyme
VASLTPFEGDAATVAGWLRSPKEAALWAGVTEWPVPASLFAEWHADPDVVAFLLVDDGGEAVAYGELWQENQEAELARLVVDPARRGRGLGRLLVGALIAEARSRGLEEIWLRVVPDNEAAVRCYLGAGFVRASPDEEAAFNVGQPRVYAWMRFPA